MFSKSKGEPPARGTRASTGADPSALTIIAAGVTITGNIDCTGDMHLNGSVDGDISCASLVQGETGAVAGMVQARQVTLRGRVEGEVRAEAVVLERSAHVIGQIHYKTISIEAGAIVDGSFSSFAAAAASAGTEDEALPSAPPVLKAVSGE